MNVVIFCGPSLPISERTQYADFQFRPPVRQGDLYGATRERPAAIGIIDGLFDGVPSVWHKEVLWALAEGIAVFGAASMGALRAAELHPFGMLGIGKIFEDYRDGRLNDDDEVALLHGPAETGYIALSEPMVNVRATLDHAVAEGVIEKAAADAIGAAAKAQFYQERTWETVMTAAEAQLPADTARHLTTWLAGGKVDQKRADAVLLLEAIDRFVKEGARSSPASFAFEFTQSWANAPWRSADSETDEEAEAILDELRLSGDDYNRLRQRALLDVLAHDALASSGLEPDRRDVYRVLKAFRAQRGMSRQADVARWASDNDISIARLEQLMAQCAGLEKLQRVRDKALRSALLDQLRLADSYAEMRRRARAKAPLREAAARQTLARVPPPVLVSWYFSTQLKQPVPDNLADYAANLGLDGLPQFYELLALAYAQAHANTHARDNAVPRRSGGPRKKGLS